jgi:hypothetical protein
MVHVSLCERAVRTFNVCSLYSFPSSVFASLICPRLPRELESRPSPSHAVSSYDLGGGVSTFSSFAYTADRLCKLEVHLSSTSLALGSIISECLCINKNRNLFLGHSCFSNFSTIVKLNSFGRLFEIIKCYSHLTMNIMSVMRSYDAQISSERNT